MPKTNAKDYAKLNQELADITAWFESGEARVDQAIAKYEHALKLIAEIEKYLKLAENRLHKIKAKLD